MKMPEKHDLLAAILARKGTRHRGNPCGLVMRTFAADIMAVRLQTVIDATMRHYRLCSFVTFSTSADHSSNLAYITSVFIGYIGIDSIGSLISHCC